MSLTWQDICNLRNYQSDFHKIIFSVSKTTRELLLKWGNDPVQLSSEVKMPQFLVEEVIAETCDETSVMGEHHITIILQGCLEELLKVLKTD